MAKHNILGAEGEKLAADFLIKSGYEILERNWRFERKEVDIIARKDKIIAIVEVKTRSTDYFGLPEESVTLSKQKFLIEAADEYAQQQDCDIDLRFDIISVIISGEKTSVNHIEDAFIPLAE